MGWIGAAIAAVGSIASSSQSSKGAKKAGKKGRKAAQAQIDFARETMNLARADTRHTRQAGATALNALMSLTGLSGGGGGARYDENGWPIENQGGGIFPQDDTPQGNALAPPRAIPDQPRISGGGYDRSSGYMPRYAGGPTEPNTIYNINEMGPENVYSGGAITRGRQPSTINGQTGYVEPNVEGRGRGGRFGGGPDVTAWQVTGSPSMTAYAMMKSKKPPRGKLPNTDWIRNDRGRIKATGQGHWNNDLNAYVDRRGRPKKHQTAPPEGWQDPSTQTDIDTTQGTDYNFQTDPGYQFRFEEGQRALDRGAAARGGLLSGGYGRKAIRYGQGFASNEYTNVYNRIANIAGMGQTANQFAGNAAMMGGQMMGAGALNAGTASAYGAQGSANAWGNAATNVGAALGSVNWNNVFNRQQPNQPQSSGRTGGP